MMRKLKQTPVIVKAVILKTKWTPFEDKLAAVPEATQSQPGRSGQDKVGMRVEQVVILFIYLFIQIFFQGAHSTFSWSPMGPWI